ncbi:MAG: Hint domain-containing protein [Rhodobacterales bacterium]|nr:Hint domain-containing protein [Rhodobacterales bacterium]
MATFQLGFHAFGTLGIVDVTGPSGIQQATDTAQGIGTPGERFRVLDAASPVTELWVEDADPDSTDGLVNEAGIRAVVAAGSPFGMAGRPVDLACRITVTTSETPARELTCFVLRVGGVNAGLVGTEPLRAGVDYAVLRATDQDMPTTLQRFSSFGPVGPDQPGQTLQPWNAIFCFTHGTLIDTPDGARLIEELRPGDLVTTLDNGSQTLRWIGTRSVSAAEMQARPDLCPIRFEIGALGNQRPLLVSPQHRILLSDWRAQVYFGEDQVLVAAKAMENDTTIRAMIPRGGVVYCHLLFDRHEVIVSEGTLSESFHPGEAGLGSLDAAQRAEIAALFPHLPVERRRAAFPIVKPSEARALRLPG